MHLNDSFTQLLFSTVRIIVRARDLQEGVGTGFVFHRSISQKEYVPLLVTNRHVVEDKVTAQFSFTVGEAGRPLIGHAVTVTQANLNECWCFHPDPKIDLAVSPLQPLLELAEAQGRPVFYKALPDQGVLGDEYLQKLISSEEIAFVGYPKGLQDSENLTPILRRGFTATSYALNFGGKPSFLIDAMVAPGSSGSPVMLVRSRELAGLMGIVNGYLTMDEVGNFEIENHRIDAPKIGEQSLGIGTVVKATELIVLADKFIQMHGLSS